MNVDAPRGARQFQQHVDGFPSFRLMEETGVRFNRNATKQGDTNLFYCGLGEYSVTLKNSMCSRNPPLQWISREDITTGSTGRVRSIKRWVSIDSGT